MKFIDEVVEEGVTERRFELEVGDQRVPGILWTPTGARGPRPLLLQGHGGIQHKRVPNVLALAQRMVRKQGYAVAAIDAPGHGDRVTPEQAERMRQRVVAAAGRRDSVQSDEQRKAMVKGAQLAVAEWRATLDALQQLDEVGAQGPVGYWGVSMGTRYGIPLIATDSRIKCAVLGLYGAGKQADEVTDAAHNIKIPLLFMFQLHDELMTPESGLALFSAFGSEIKSMHINPGPHVGIPMIERDYYETFFVRHLGSAASPVQAKP
jgi:dienelactone hydrolase